MRWGEAYHRRVNVRNVSSRGMGRVDRDASDVRVVRATVQDAAPPGLYSSTAAATVRTPARRGDSTTRTDARHMEVIG
jgi:hypothetical protein